MRILAVRGGNLASLAEPFDLDFSSPPLKDAGLFAITGPTGAGKSTLLDAICLALYDRFPRIADGGREAEIGGAAAEAERLVPTDPRTILRRGAAECFAEVDFAGIDGRRYRARWTARRARGKATGALQKQDLKLQDMDGGRGLGGTRTETLKEIERRVGLTFDQFRRTVLLAQNDFDAFLRANEKDRAELLEKITGTEIYADMSRRAFEREAEARKAVKAEEDARALIAALQPEARAALEQNLAEARRQAADQRAARDRLQAAAAWRRTLTELEAEQEQARIASGRAEAAWREAEETRRLAASVAQAEQARDVVAAAEAAERRVSEAQADLAAARERLDAAEAARAGTAQTFEAAERRVKALETEFKALERDWTRAAELDRAITEARKEAEQSRKAEEEAGKEAEEAGKAAAAAQSGILALQARAEENRAWRADHEDDGLLARRIDEIAASLDDLEKAWGETAAAEREIAAAGEALAGLDAERRAGEEKAAGLAADIADLKRREDECRNALAAIGGPALRERHEALGSALAAFERVRDAAAALLGDEEEQEREKARQVEAEERKARAAALLASLDPERAAADAARDEARQARERAEKAAGDQAALLRSVLVAGEPCPVCGAIHHPWRDRPAPLDALLMEARRRQAETEEAAGAVRTRIEQAEAECGAMDHLIADAAAQLEKIAARLAIRRETFRGRFADWSRAAAAAGLDGGAGDARSILAPVLKTSIGALEAELHGGRKMLAKAADHEARADALRLSRDAKAESLRKVEAGQTGNLRRRAELEASRAGHEARRAGAADEAARLIERLAFVTAPRGLDACDLRRDLAAFRRNMRSAAEAWIRREKEGESLAAALNEAGTALRLATAKREAAEDALARAKQEALRRAAQLAQLDAERAGFLGGVPTATHRSDFESRLAAAREAQAQTGRVHAEARDAHAAARAACAAAETALATARKALGQAVAARDKRLASLGLALDAVHALLGKGQDWLAATQAELARLERERHNTALLRDEIDGRIVRHHADAPEDAAEESGHRIEEAEARLSSLEQEAGALSQQLADDDARRRAARDAEGRIGDLRLQHDVLRAVSEAIGSSDGSKFRRFVQSITLDQLLVLANEQFATLNPRYRLERAPAGDLSLQIRDLEMGDEVRSVRSLSGGERFLASLALALGLSDLSGRRAFARTLFIDEGFGALDAASLDTAVGALEALQSRGRQVGVISHVDAMTDRIAVQVRVMKAGAGRSRVSINVDW